jgi:DNA-binding XRE family transcriptional regulator
MSTAGDRRQRTKADGSPMPVAGCLDVASREMRMFPAVSAPTQVDPALAAVVRRIRIERGDTQEDLAHRAGLTVAAFARIERGHANPTWTTVRRIAAALEVSLSSLAESVERHKPRN